MCSGRHSFHQERPSSLISSSQHCQLPGLSRKTALKFSDSSAAMTFSEIFFFSCVRPFILQPFSRENSRTDDTFSHISLGIQIIKSIGHHICPRVLVHSSLKFLSRKIRHLHHSSAHNHCIWVKDSGHNRIYIGTCLYKLFQWFFFLVQSEHILYLSFRIKLLADFLEPPPGSVAFTAAHFSAAARNRAPKVRNVPQIQLRPIFAF